MCVCVCVRVSVCVCVHRCPKPVVPFASTFVLLYFCTGTLPFGVSICTFVLVNHADLSTRNRFPKPAEGLIPRAEGRRASSSLRPHRAIEYLESFSETSRAPAAHHRVGDVSEEVPFASVFVLVYLVNLVVHQLLIAE